MKPKKDLLLFWGSGSGAEAVSEVTSLCVPLSPFPAPLAITTSPKCLLVAKVFTHFSLLTSV